ncbi:hypothetical protein DYB28_007970 [Aphanomyces astaci]|uniref:Uncharacterized protein n=1 Tax=Aphanomyces astaci TaxID=112090 RepID=A0A3L6UPH4_APHAT|nr:hypothetical protein DYB34_001744 [Aphanomyces astaci]RLN85667.1 hypothetical protein DYB28_007970 [Aphanomyces astaci]
MHLTMVVLSFQSGIFDTLRPVYAYRETMLHKWPRLAHKHIGHLEDPRSVLFLLIEQNQLDGVQRLLRCRPRDWPTSPWPRGTSSSPTFVLRPHPMDSAAALGRVEILKFLHTASIGHCTTSAMDLAARNGHLEVVKFLHHHRQEGCTTWAANWAAEYGHLHVLRFLLDNRSEGFTAYAVAHAAHDWIQRALTSHSNKSQNYDQV